MGKCLYEGDVKDCPNYPTFCAECFDSHNCRDEMNDYGICTCCGAVVRGTAADYSIYGYDPPENPWKY